MNQDYLLFPEFEKIETHCEIKTFRRRRKKMAYYFSNLAHNRLKRQGTDATLLQKKKGLLPLEANCVKCKDWCEKSILKYHHVNEQFPYAVVPTCPECHKKLESLKIQNAIEIIDRQIYFVQLFYHEIDRSERDNRIYESAARNMTKGGFPYNHNEKIVINY